MKYYIYTLNDPDTGRVRYIGYTKNLYNRFIRHMKAAKEKIKWPLYNWINHLLRDHKKPVMVIIESGFGDWNAREQLWIAHYRNLQCDILNVCDGGHFNPPEEARKRAGEKLKNRYFSPEHRRKISEAKKGCKRPDQIERFRAIAAANKGKKMVLADAERKRRATVCRNLPKVNPFYKMTPQQRSEVVKKAWMTRKKNKEKMS